jgi:hypothetical protein
VQSPLLKLQGLIPSLRSLDGSAERLWVLFSIAGLSCAYGMENYQTRVAT